MVITSQLVVRQDERLADREPLERHAIGEDHRDADKQRETAGSREDLPIRIADHGVGDHRHAHGERKGRQKDSDDEEDGAEIEQ